ncbi:MAG: hypothetical protein QMD12_03375 [Candidatus Aenigmarchaeota archaeon]|nr:hypothetical protein [Candidatus Aenigmarchaeota archaeon]
MTTEDIRDDIFPNLQDTLLWRRNEEIKKYLEETQKCLERFFSSLANLIEYVNGFDRPEDVELLIEICRFYNIVKNFAQHPFLKFIMMISIFERLSCDKYLSFHDWLVVRQNRETLENKISEIVDYDSLIAVLNTWYKDYINVYGLKRNLLVFFKDNLTENEKIKLIRSFHVRRTKYIERAGYVLLKKAGRTHREYRSIEEYSNMESQPLDEKLLPYCYDWKNCYIEDGKCCPDVICRLKDNEEALDKEFNRIIGIIYDYRSMFVHRARSPPFNGNNLDFIIDVYDGRPIIIHLNLSELQEMLENPLKKHFDRLHTSSVTS